MYQTTSAFVQQMDAHPFQALLTAGESSAAADSLSYSAAWCPSDFTLGAASSAGFTATLRGESCPFQAGDQVALAARLEWGDGTTENEEVPLGKFTLTRVERAADTDQWTLAGSDALGTALEEEFFCGDPEDPPATAPEVLAEICARAGLTLEGGGLVPQTPMALEYDAAGGSGETMRALVGQIALLAGANALMTRAGNLKLCRLEQTGLQIGAQRYYESGLTLEGADFTLGALEVDVQSTETGENGTQESRQVFSAQLEGQTQGIRLTSPWMDQSAFDGLWQAWQGKSWRPAQVTFLGDVRLDPGDLIAVTDRAGTSYTLAVMGLEHSFDGGWRTTVRCSAPQESGGAAAQSVSQAISGLKTDLGRFRRLYADNLDATQAQIRHITTEDVVGEYGTINLAEGTFAFGDALIWDGSRLTVKGVLDSEEGTIGGWTIDGKTLYSISSGGGFKMELKPAQDDEYPYILFQGANGTWARIEPYIQENSGEVQRLELSCGGAQLDLCQDGTVQLNGSTVAGVVTAQGISGEWNYIKYSDGQAICSRTMDFSGVYIGVAVGSLYRSSIHVMPSLAYPFTFTAPPTELVSLRIHEEYVFLMGTGHNTVTASGAYTLASPVSHNSAETAVWGRFSQVVLGRWK